MVEKILYHKGSDDVWSRCIRSDEKKTILREAHYRIAGGHYAGDVTA